MFLRYLLAWLPMVVIAIANGALRDTTYGKRMSELRAHQLSTLTGAVLIGVYVWLLVRLWGFSSGGQAMMVGLAWVLLTVAFEFLFGHYVVGNPWRRTLHDYNLFAGRVWLLFLLWLAVSP